MKDKVNWEVKGDRVFFIPEQKTTKEIPSSRMITTSIEYATEMNRII